MANANKYIQIYFCNPRLRFFICHESTDEWICLKQTVTELKILAYVHVVDMVSSNKEEKNSHKRKKILYTIHQNVSSSV